MDKIPNPTEQAAPSGDITDVFRQALDSFSHPTILELGSRQVTAENLLHVLGVPDGSYSYIGLDIHPGPNVDVVGDAHQLSRHISANSIDVIVSKSVFEHLAMPWKIVLEMNRVLKKGGLILTNTFLTFPEHELPWDFWRYTVQGWRVLFNEWTGFEVVMTELNDPCRIEPLYWHPDWKPENMLSHINSNVLARKTGEYDSERLKWDLSTTDILKSIYPPPPPTG